MQDKRREDHTLTTREVMQIFEDAGLSRNQRSIERYCDQGKLDCFKDPDELRYYITRASAERLIGHLKELEARHQQVNLEGAYQERPTGEHPDRPGPTPPQSPASMKQSTSENNESATARAEYEHKLKALEDTIFNLEVDKRAKDQMVTMLRDQLTVDRDHYTNLLQVNTDKLTKYSRRLGQLETEVKQLKAPDRDTSADDRDDIADREAIEAEFSEADALAEEQQSNVSMNEHQP